MSGAGAGSAEPRAGGPRRRSARRPRRLGTSSKATSTPRLGEAPGDPPPRPGPSPTGDRNGKEDPKRQRFAGGASLARQEEGQADADVPWCVSAIYEKHLMALGEEINRLSWYETECARKDSMISVLRGEVGSLKQQLDLLKDTVVTEAKNVSSQLLTGNSESKIFSLTSSRDDSSIASSSIKKSLRGSGMLKIKTQYTEMEQKSPSKEVAEEVLSDVDAERAFQEHSEAQEQALMAKVTELQKANQELCEELQMAKNDHNMATGAISSLQRQLEIQESQLRRTKSEKETLQKELRERENQLQAMSTKFCNLREGRKHEEMMVTIEKENCSLRQTVTKQESKLAEQNKLISELQRTVSQLQAKVLVNEYHIREQQRAQEAIQSQADTLQHTEQQTKVALQCLTSRFERYRSKIIQATFSTAGSKSPQAELTDEEVLEAMQKIINERMEFHQMLKQKGVKVPSLYSLDPSASSPTNSRSSRKSPLK